MTPRFLLSFHYYKDHDLEKFVELCGGAPVDLFVDSGGYSAMSVGAAIDFNAYVAFIKRWAPLITAYANLDVIGDPVATLANQERMEAEGLEPLPVFHYGSPWSYLEAYVERHQCVALGGLVGRSARVVMPWLVQAFRIAERTGTRYHGFGVTGWQHMVSFPWRSVDSSSWASGYRYGNLRMFNPRTRKLVQVNIHDRKAVYRHAELIRLLGCDPAKVEERDTMIALSARSVVAIEQYLTARWGGTLRAASTTKSDSDIAKFAGAARVYMVDGSDRHLHTAATQVRVYMAGGLKEATPQITPAAAAAVKVYSATSPLGNMVRATAVAVAAAAVR